MSTQSPKCRLCGHAHRLCAPHIWDDEPKEKPKNVPTMKKNVPTIIEKPKNVPTIRQVSMDALDAVASPSEDIVMVLPETAHEEGK